MLTVAIIPIYFGIKGYPNYADFGFFAGGGFSLLIFLYLSFKRYSILKRWKFFSGTTKILYIISFLGIFIIFASYSGSTHAINTIEGTTTIEMVNFTWKDNPPDELKSKELILIMHYNGNFYVTEKQKPAPKYPEIFIIPDNQIKYTTIKKY